MLLDNRTRLHVDNAASGASGLRLLRPGRRAAHRADGERVVALDLGRIPLP